MSSALRVDLVARRMRPNLPLYRQNGDLYPLFAFRRELKHQGTSLRLHTWEQAKGRSGRLLCVDSRALSYHEGRVHDRDLETLASFRSHFDRIVWLDNRDSSGTTQFEVLPFVDTYCKKQYLRDRSLYRTSLYANRLFTDYYHREYGIADDKPERRNEPLASEYESKLKLHWNLAYRPFGQRNKAELYAHLFLPTRPPRFVPWSATKRDIDLQVRYGLRYDNRTVAFQRRALLDAVERFRNVEVKAGRTDPRHYLAELARTAAVLSPFGYGEVCVRDFEAFIYGAALIKPDSSHLETWPDLYKENATYLPISWDPMDAAAQLEELLGHREQLESIAMHGQSEYRKLWSREGIETFCERFAGLLRG